MPTGGASADHVAPLVMAEIVPSLYLPLSWKCCLAAAPFELVRVAVEGTMLRARSICMWPNGLPPVPAAVPPSGIPPPVPVLVVDDEEGAPLLPPHAAPAPAASASASRKTHVTTLAEALRIALSFTRARARARGGPKR